jgi:hypothetical protein
MDEFLMMLQRSEYQAERTFGVLSLDWHDTTYRYHTLEDKVRDKKIYGRTAIAAGKYEVKLTYSPRFQHNMPLLMNVPEFVGVRIHIGNTENDTEGCILVGRSRSQSQLLYSRAAYNELMQVLQEVLGERKQIYIDIRS